MMRNKRMVMALSLCLAVTSLMGCDRWMGEGLEPVKGQERNKSELIMPTHAAYQPEEQLKTYYEQWKDGNRSKKPGYVKDFRLPEPEWLPWESPHSTVSTQGASGINGTLGTLGTLGSIVLMVPNGTPEELTADYCVSTDEAMGYGMIIAALMEDRELFDRFLRVVLYYKNQKNPNLSLWAIPAKQGKDWFQTETYKQLSDAAKREWRESGVQFDPLYEDPQSTIVVGESMARVRNSGSATDGELDIAYALYLAHDKWERGSGEKHYLKLARSRFKAILSELVLKYGRLPEGSGHFLPTGDYLTSYESQSGRVTAGITRPCDFMVAQLRTYYEDSKDPKVLELIETLYAQSEQLANSVTGMVPDFAKWDNGLWVPCEEGIANEWMSDYFYMNSARYPFRMAMDTYHYGDQRGAERALKIVGFLKEKYGDASPAAIHTLDGQAHPEGLWENPVLAAALYSAAAFSGKSEYQSYINQGWEQLRTQFDSRHNDWDGNGLGSDPAHSGYFGDTWRLLGLLGMSGKWEPPMITE